jgi:arylsulfatase A-like enzyme
MKRLLLNSLLLAGAITLHAAEQSRNPNIVLIVSDDMGYADLGFTGVKDIKTPNLDRLAAAGTFFTDAYVTGPICVPSRMGIMTGRNQARWGVYNNNGGQWPEGQKRTAAETTIAEIFQQAGYATALFGKWHLCGGRAEQRVAEAVPERNGFDEVEMIPGGMSGFWAGAPLYRAGGGTVKAPEYLTDHFGKLAVGFIERHKEKPFFLALTFNAVHAPLHALDADKQANGEIAAMDRRTYAGMMTAMDRNIGQVLDAIAAAGLEPNTIVAFLSDNGGPAPDAEGHSRNASGNGPLRGYKFDVWEGGVRTPMVMKWPGHIPSGKRFAGLSSSMDLGATFLAAAGLSAPADKPLDGVNLLPFLNGEKTGDPHDALFWECRWFPKPDCAARSGTWKIVQREVGPNGPDPAMWQLFDLGKDIGEQNNLAAQHPERVREMDKAFRNWRAQMAAPIQAPKPGAKKPATSKAIDSQFPQAE